MAVAWWREVYCSPVAYVVDGGENKTTVGLGIKTLLVLQQRGGGLEEKKRRGAGNQKNCACS
jgi:hypothetical protein